ncbi:MAG: di-trans,poly-cis-decaprenylcistransferase [Armatimonadetes bacterium]|nr:di-trans,poly-cis-decaprenylcistransferase [Armatimonadota bacterium]
MTPEADSPAPEQSAIPRHIAVVMDGNGRWARQRGLSRVEGHYEGRKATRRLVEECVDLNLGFLTIYTFSTENWARSQEEVAGLMFLIRTALAAEIEDLDRNNVRFVASGRLSELPEELQQTIAEGRAATADNTGLVLNMAVNYSGRGELADACRRIAEQVAQGRLSPDDVSEASIAESLYQPWMPDVDLLIRPGGEMRVSNFLLWQIAYAEIYVCPVLWPDFRKSHLHEALDWYRNRERRFGGVR